MYFLLFLNYLPLERVGSFNWTNLNPLHPRMLCAKFGWDWPSGSEEKKWKYGKFTTTPTTRTTTDKFIRIAHLSLWLRWGKTSNLQFIEVYEQKKQVYKIFLHFHFPISQQILITASNKDWPYGFWEITQCTTWRIYTFEILEKIWASLREVQ